MLMTVDIGNTNTNLCVFNKEDIVFTCAIQTDVNKLCDEYGITILNLVKNAGLENQIEAAVISNVVAQLDDVIKEAIEKYLKTKAYLISHRMKLPFKINIDEPKTLGADRIANAAAVCGMCDKPIIVIDFGTATTFDIISKDNNFIGGLIAPGMMIQAKSLSQFTSKLPKIRLDAPKKAIALNTIDTMMSGIVMGHGKMIDGMIEQCEKELGEKAFVIATGGLSAVLSSCMERKFDLIDKYLTHKGIKRIYEKNYEQNSIKN